MAKRKERKYQTLGDYVTMAFSPVLIMTLAGSLVFFLAEVFYAGQYEGRLLYTLFWFVMGMVLIARIQIENNDGRAKWYALGLGLAIYAALLGYIEYPPDSVAAEFRWLINLVLIAVIWWATHRLTWDSTFIDERVDASGMGVLEAAGLDEAVASPEGLAKPIEEAAEEVPDSAADAERAGWRARYRRYREEQSKRPHTPGVWVVYFSLAALPLFGLGQVLIPLADTDRRHYVFWLFVVYVGSGLGLLLTTSYLGLRRYLRQRQLNMPAAMTAVWLTVGGTMVVILLIVGAILPRPFAEYQAVNFTPFGSPERNASRYAVNRDSKAKGEGQASADSSERDPNAKSTTSGKSGKGSSNSSRENSREQGRNNQERSENAKDGKDNDSRNNDSSEDKSKKNDNANRSDGKDDQRDGPSKQASGSGRSSRSGSSNYSQKTSDRSMPEFLSKLTWLGKLLKWIVFAVLALIVGFYLLRSGLRWLANFTDWAKNLLASLQSWWESLFARRERQAGVAGEADPEKHIEAPRPFGFFSDPFLDGSAEQLSPNQLVRYSFEALQSWAWERKLGRQAAETPREFVERLVAELPGLDREARGLGTLYARIAYARANLGSGALDPLRRFWLRLHEVGERPLSA